MNIGQFSIVDLGQDGAQIVYPNDRDLNARFRSAFPRAVWMKHLSAWGVPGPLATRRLTVWAARIEQELAAAQRAFENACMDAEFDGRLHEVDPAAALRRRRDDFTSRRVAVFGCTVYYPFRYVSEAVEVARSMPNYHFDPRNKCWSWRVDHIDQVDHVIAGVNAITEIEQKHIRDDRYRTARGARRTRTDVGSI